MGSGGRRLRLGGGSLSQGRHRALRIHRLRKHFGRNAPQALDQQRRDPPLEQGADLGTLVPQRRGAAGRLHGASRSERSDQHLGRTRSGQSDRRNRKPLLHPQRHTHRRRQDMALQHARRTAHGHDGGALRPDQRLYDLGRAFRPRTPLLRTPRLRRFDLVAEERSERFGREHMDRKGPRRRRTVASGRLQLFGDGLLVQKTRQLQVQAHHGRQRLHGGTLSVARTPACRPLPALRRSAQRMRQGRGRHLLARQSPRTRRPEGRERVVGHLRHHEEIRHPDRAARNHPPRENPRNDVRRIALLGPAPLEGGRKTT